MGLINKYVLTKYQRMMQLWNLYSKLMDYYFTVNFSAAVVTEYINQTKL